MLVVQKFGGSSVADAQRLRHAARICLGQRRRECDLIVVVSAMADSTDRLLELAGEINPNPNPRELDALLSTGEQQSAALLAMTLQSMGAKAESLTGWQAGIITESRHKDADIDLIAEQRLRELLSRGIIPVVCGFQGIDLKGDICCLGRGGSDTTAVALSAALGADRCEIYTDVDGIYTADPRRIKDARKLESIDFRDMLALAEAGSQVLHPKSVEIAMLNKLEMWVLSSFQNSAGSRVGFLPRDKRPGLAGITRKAQTLSLAGKGANAAALSAAVLTLAEAGISVLDGSIEQGRICIKPEEEKVTQAMELLHRRLILEEND